MRSLQKGLFSSPRALAAVGLAVAVGLMEGITILLLLPLLRLAGVPVEGNVGNISASLASIFARIGISPTLITVLLIYVSLTCVQAILTYARTLAETRAIQTYTIALRTRLYSAVARTRWLVISRIRTSDLTFALTTAIDQTELGAANLLFLIANGVVAIVYIALAVRVSPLMSSIVIGTAALLLLAERARTLLGFSRGSDVASTTNELYASAAEQLGGLKTAKSYGQEERHLSLFLETSDQVNKARAALNRAFGALRLRTTIGSVIALSFILFLAVDRLKLPTAAVLLLLFLFSRLVPRLIGLQQTYQEILSSLPALETIERLIRECEGAPEREMGKHLPVSLTRAVELAKVSFSYTNSPGASHITGVNMRVLAGRTTAIVGPSGSGKSTVADLILGLISPQTGEVLIDDVPLASEQLGSWRSQIGYVGQDTFLFNDTIRFNLDWASPGSTDAEILAAIKDASAMDFVAAFPDGINTVIGERGVRLSGGERQRVSLARAVLRKPALLILDEATSALDSENEERIHRAIAELHGVMTILIITHRLSSIRNVDTIYVLDAGKVVASGSWDELIAGVNPRFRELCRAQGLEV